MRRAPQLGQKPRRLQLKATSFSWAQSAQRRRKKPWARMPHRRKASNSALTNRASLSRSRLRVGSGKFRGVLEPVGTGRFLRDAAARSGRLSPSAQTGLPCPSSLSGCVPLRPIATHRRPLPRRSGWFEGTILPIAPITRSTYRGLICYTIAAPIATAPPSLFPGA